MGPVIAGQDFSDVMACLCSSQFLSVEVWQYRQYHEHALANRPNFGHYGESSDSISIFSMPFGTHRRNA